MYHQHESGEGGDGGSEAGALQPHQDARHQFNMNEFIIVSICHMSLAHRDLARGIHIEKYILLGIDPNK